MIAKGIIRSQSTNEKRTVSKTPLGLDTGSSQFMSGHCMTVGRYSDHRMDGLCGL